MKRLALLSALLLAAPAFADTPLTYNRVDFQSEISREIPNDQLNATLSIELSDKDPAKLARDLTAAMNEALKKAKSYSTVKASTGNQQTWPIYGKAVISGANKLESWRGRAELKLETRDFKAAGELISQLQDKLQLAGINFSVAESTRRELENTLSSEAIANFRGKADKIRDAWSAKSYRLVNMSLGTAGDAPMYRPVMMKAAMADGAEAAPAQDFAGGTARLTINVSGTIELQQ